MQNTINNQHKLIRINHFQLSSLFSLTVHWTEEPGGLLSIGSHRVGHDWSDLACMHVLEKEMATHSRILAWRIPGTEEPRGLPSMGSHRVGHDWSNLAAAASHWTYCENKVVMDLCNKRFKWYLSLQPLKQRTNNAWMLKQKWLWISLN